MYLNYNHVNTNLFIGQKFPSLRKKMENRNNRQNFRSNNRPRFQPIVLDEEPIKTEFMANVNFFEKIRPKLEQAAKRIRDAISNQQRIILKHHNDTDGFCSGLILDRAIVPLIEKTNEKRQAAWEKFRRLPSMTPFYNLEDATKDIAQFLLLKSRFKESNPLVILTDLGSGPENVLPIKQLKVLGCEIIVIDHHPVDEEVDSLIDIHINPHLVNSEQEYSAGILCAELARMIRKNVEQPYLVAAISSTKGGDRVPDEFAQGYYDLAQKDGFDRNFLENIARCIDFTVSNLRNLDGKDYFDLLMGFEDREMQKKLVDTLIVELDKRIEKVITQSKAIVSKKEFDAVTALYFPVDEITQRDFYPRLGAMVGIIHELHMNDSQKPLVTLGTTSNSVTFRADENSSFNFPDMLKIIQEKVPLAFADGGGHACAGTYRCSEKHFDEVLAVVEEYLASLN